MSDDDQRQDKGNDLREQEFPPDPVDLNERRERRQNANPTPDPMRQDFEEFADELEAQAREIVRVVRENMGELGERVRQAVDHAATLWNEAAEAAPAPASDDPHPHELRARALMRRWVKRDFLVDPDLPMAMTHVGLKDAEIWRIELRERGEARALTDAIEPYTGTQPPAPGAILPVWDYDFPITPEIEAGERRETLPNSAMRAACELCHGSGHRSCGHCEGKGMTTCPQCRGRGSKVCPRCRGRGRIADPAAERQARAAKSYVQVHVERLTQNAVERLADFSERLRQDYGAPLPPSAEWAPLAPASGKTIACPDCVDGALPCVCNNGKVVCAVCHGSAYEPCPACAGSGQVIRQRQIVRRFDTRINSSVLPPTDPEVAGWASERVLRRSEGEQVWEGAESDLDGPAPSGAPASVWAEAQAFRHAVATQPAEAEASGQPATPGAGERRVLSRRVRLIRTPVTRIEYSFAGRMYEALAVGRVGEERFWAETFPPRWNRLSRFVQAVARDIAGETRQRPGSDHTLNGGAVRDRSHIRIIEEPMDEAPDTAPGHPDEPGSHPES